MAAPPRIPLILLALLATGAPAPVVAQLRDAAGALPEEAVVPARSDPAVQGPLLPTAEDEVRAAQARRRAREQQRAVASAGNPVLDPKTRGAVMRPLRGTIALRRPPNRAVPLRAGPRDSALAASQPLLQVIAPGLSEPPQKPRRKQQEDDAYAPLGVRLGGLILRPGVEANVGYDSNPLRAAPSSRPKGSKVYQGAVDLSVQSDWSRHQMRFDLRGVYNDYPDVKNADRPTLDAKLALRGDLSDQATVNLDLRERIDSQRPGSPDLTSAVKGRPLTYQSGATAGYIQRFGPASITATALVDRYDFEDAKTTSGLPVPQGDREFAQYGAALRGAYEITPGIAPFVEVGADRRVYDQAVDSGGYRRSSVGATARLGSTFELTRTLTGDVSAGYGWRDYADSRLGPLSGALVDASLVWQASPLTRATLKAGSEFLETTQAGSSGALGRRIGLLVTHDLLRNLQIGASLDYSHARYSGVNRTEQTLIAGLKIDYKIDRHFVFRTSYAYERAISSLPNNSSVAHVFLMGLRVQR